MLETDSLDRVVADAMDRDARPLWTVMDKMVPPFPEPKAVPALWRWAEMKPLLDRAGRLVAAEQAERRVLMLVNPALEPPHTTDTLFAGLQYILPGETARAHRHVAFALRFIIEGERGFTAVDGEKVTMTRGDLVLTPSWTWHDHGHEGDGPMVWLDGLDLPLYQFFPANFAEPFAQDRFPSEPAGADSTLRYPWSEMQAALDAIPGPFAERRYAHRTPGATLSRVIGAGAERLDAGASAPGRRETAGIVFHVFEGSGTTEVGTTTLRWTRGDTFCVPAWTPYRHVAGENAYLFRFDDRPVLEAIGAYRAASPSS